MVKPFQFSRLPKIYFKNGIINELASMTHLYGRKIILVTGKNSFLNSRQAERLFDEFDKSGYQDIMFYLFRENHPLKLLIRQ